MLPCPKNKRPMFYGEIMAKCRVYIKATQDAMVCTKVKQTLTGDFPGSPVVKTPRFHCREHGFDPWLGN